MATSPVRSIDEIEGFTQRRDLALAAIAHELRGPLLGVSAWMQVLIHTPQEHEKFRAILERCTSEIEELVAVLDGLLSSVITGEAPRSRHVDLVSVVREAVRNCTGEESVRVAISAPEALIVNADPAQLRQAIFNLLRNALDYSPPQSEVEISVRRIGDKADVTIKDRGPGIPDSERETIFDPLSRGAAGRAARRGKGLGLFIARQVVHAHQGTLWLDPSSDEGSAFHIQLSSEGR